MHSDSQFERESKALLKVMVGTTAVGAFLLTRQVRVLIGGLLTDKDDSLPTRTVARWTC